MLRHKIDGWLRQVSFTPPQSQMSSTYILRDSNGDEFYLNQNYVRYGNRILDASFIATISVKKHKLLFNNFKQNTTLPVLSVPFKKETDARHAMNLCLEFYDIAPSNPFYGANDERIEVFLADAFGGVMHVTPEYLKYRDRVLNTSDVRCVHVKGRRVLVNHFKGNVNVPTMCVHFIDKNVAEYALSNIQSILWNVAVPTSEPASLAVKPESTEAPDSRAMGVLDKPADPIFLQFMTIGISFLLALNFLRMMVGSEDNNDEL